MAGVRCGFVLTSEELAAGINKVPGSWIPGAAQAEAVAALTDEEYYSECKEKIIAGKEYIAEELEKLGCTVYPSQSNFIMYDPHCDIEELRSYIIDKGILTTMALGLGRVSVGTPQQNGLFRSSMNNSKVSMVVSMVMNGLNIAGNAIFIYVFNMGVAGVGYATLISRAVACVVMMTLIRSEKFEIHACRYSCHSNRTGFVTIVGQCVGANDYRQARYYSKKLLEYAYLFLIILNVIIFLSAPVIAGWYNLSEMGDYYARQLIRYHSVCCMLLWPLAFTIPNILRAAGDAKFTMIVSIISMWVFRVGLAYVIGGYLKLGVLGVWIAMTIDWAVRAVFNVIRLKGDKWECKSVI